MPPEDQTRIRHMIEAAEAALRFVSGRSRGDLDSDQMLLFAVVRALEIIGEAASRVSEPTRLTTSDVPWARAAAMRNRLPHAYFTVDPEIIWKTATEELPALLPGLRSLLFAR